MTTALQLPCTLFKTKKQMDDYSTSDMHCSDLLGFYRAVSIQNPFPQLRPVSKEEALKLWDYYGKIGNWKNEKFQPQLFPDPEKFPHSRPRKGVLPPFMETISPYDNFSSGNVICSKKNDETFVVLGAGNNRMGL